MQTIEKTIEIDRPVSTVYSHWIQFEDFPKFMEGIKKVRKIDDKYLHWEAEIGGRSKRWDAEILEQVPDQRIEWRSTSGAENSGTLTFISLTSTKTRVILHISYDPKGIFENLGDNLGMVSSKITGDLNRFKAFIESGGGPSENEPVAEAVLSANP